MPDAPLNLDFLKHYEEEDAMGPVQRDEAALLYGLTRVIRPRLVVEFGAEFGASTRCFLEAGAGRVVAVNCEISPAVRDLAGRFPNLIFVHKRQEECDGTEWGSEAIDLCFIDASHDLALNKRTFRVVERLMRRPGWLVIHDTGLWRREFIAGRNAEHAARVGIACGNYVMHQPGEVEFVEWIRATRPYDVVDLSSIYTLRHGMSIVAFR
jgi:predicted O-methyltransferase YrrM